MNRPGRRFVWPARLALALLGVAAAVGGLAIAAGSGQATTYAGASTAAAVVTVTAGLALLVAGLLLIFERRGYAGDLALAAGFTWFVPLWIAWQDGSPLVRSLATAIAPLTFALLVNLVLAWPGGRLPSPWARALAVFVYAEAIAAAILLALVRDPYLDPRCWANCAVNSFLVSSKPSLTQAVENTDRWLVASAAVSVALICVFRLGRASTAARVRLAPVLLPALLLACAVVAHAFALQRITIEDPYNPTLRAIYSTTAVAVTLLAGGLVLAATRRFRERRAIQRAVLTLGDAPAPGSVEAALADALGDPELQIAYPRARRGWIDSKGQAIVRPEPQPDRILTRLTRGEQPVAMVDHSDVVVDLDRHLGPSILLGLENERLQAEVLAELADLRASRARIVETADRERQELERNLHDGAQQHILALSYDLRVALAAAEKEGDRTATATLEDAIEQTQSALAELRELAHGIYPAVLAEAGLGPALATLADTAPVPVTITGDVGFRYPPAVENAAFFAAAEALADSTQRHAVRAELRLDRRNGHLILVVADDGVERFSALSTLADRVGALGGTLTLEPRSLRAEIPCA
jgi:signal transduction histidine kinase